MHMSNSGTLVRWASMSSPCISHPSIPFLLIGFAKTCPLFHRVSCKLFERAQEWPVLYFLYWLDQSYAYNRYLDISLFTKKLTQFVGIIREKRVTFCIIKKRVEHSSPRTLNFFIVISILISDEAQNRSYPTELVNHTFIWILDMISDNCIYMFKS